MPIQRSNFLSSGTMHLVAISGLHVTGVALALHYLCLILQLPPRSVAALVLTALFLYVEITGNALSARRAFLMVTFSKLPEIIHPSSPFSSLIASAVLVLAVQPLQLWNPGFQLSYAIVASIILYALPLISFLQPRLVLFSGLSEQSHQRIHKTMLFHPPPYH